MTRRKTYKKRLKAAEAAAVRAHADIVKAIDADLSAWAIQHLVDKSFQAHWNRGYYRRHVSLAGTYGSTEGWLRELNRATDSFLEALKDIEKALNAEASKGLLLTLIYHAQLEAWRRGNCEARIGMTEAGRREGDSE